MKKHLLGITLILTAGLLTTACGAASGQVEKKETAASKYTYNDAYSETLMYTLSGQKANASEQDLYVYEENGTALLWQDSWDDMSSMEYIYMDSIDSHVLLLSYIPIDALNTVYTVMQDGEEDAIINAAINAAIDAQVPVFAVYRSNSGESLSADAQAMVDRFKESEALLTAGKDSYSMLYAADVSTEGLSEEDLGNLTEMNGLRESIRDALVLFDPSTAEVSSASGSGIDLSDFTATDVNGSSFSNADFASYDITMVNCWTTWCQYCIEEMPELEKLHQMLPENVNLISICFDAADDPETCAQEIADTGITFPVLAGDASLDTLVNEYLYGYPSTFFVDKDGHLVGEVQTGAPAAANVAEAYMELISQALEQMK